MEGNFLVFFEKGEREREKGVPIPPSTHHHHHQYTQKKQEMSFVFAALWNYKVLYLYWTLVLALALLLAATALSSVVAVYSLLCAEDHRWHWAAFGAGFSPAAYAFGYCVRYFFPGTQMRGAFQSCFYFGWSLLLCLALGTATGSVGFLASAAFVRRIYRSVKCD